MSLISSKRNFLSELVSATLRSGFFVTICDPSETGRSSGALWSPSIKTVDFVDRKLFLRLLSIKSGVFVDGNVTDKKETPSKGCLHNYLAMRCPISVGYDVIAVLVIASLPA